MTTLEIILPIFFGLSTFMVLIRKHKNKKKRTEEITRLEKILDDNGIHYEPSSMYRCRNGWKNYFKWKKRKYCKTEEIRILGEENIVNWEEFNGKCEY